MIWSPILLASLLLAAGEKPVKSTEGLEARWRGEYPRAAEEWEAVARDFVAKGRFSYRWNNGSTTITPKLTVASSGKKRLFVKEDNRTQIPGSPDRLLGSVVYVQTPDLQFDLKKAPSSKHYIISDYQRNEEDSESQFNYWYKKFARNATVYWGISFLDRMRDPSFALHSIEAVKRDAGDLVRIVYAYEGKYSFESGAVELDPDKNWAIRLVDIDTKGKKDGFPSHLKIEVGYRKIDGKRFFPTRMESFDRTAKPEIFSHATLELDQVTLGGVSDDLFRMSTYGVPDMPLTPEARASVFTFRNPIFWLALLTAVASFTLLWVLRSRRDRVQ